MGKMRSEKHPADSKWKSRALAAEAVAEDLRKRLEAGKTQRLTLALDDTTLSRVIPVRQHLAVVLGGHPDGGYVFVVGDGDDPEAMAEKLRWALGETSGD